MTTLLRQIANLLQEGQVCLAAIHAHNNSVGTELLESLSQFVSAEILTEFNQLVDELNGRTND